jgi:hypothetical protein
MIVEQNFNSHLVHEIHKVKLATSGFKDFAQIWWRQVTNLHQQPQSWDRLKEAMRDRFVPVSYKRDLRKKLQRLEQEDMSVQEYFAEVRKGMILYGIEEDLEDKLCHFYGGLRREIQDIVYYKDFNTTNQLFQLAMLAEKELQEHQQKNQTNIGDNLNQVLVRVEQAFTKIETAISRQVVVSAATTASSPTPPIPTLEHGKILNSTEIVQLRKESVSTKNEEIDIKNENHQVHKLEDHFYACYKI